MTPETIEYMKQALAHGYDDIPVMPDSPSMVDKPKHYQDKDGKDLFQKWYEQHDFNTFRHIMRATAERYTSRYENKNGIEDLEKGIYTLNRLKEYESLEG